jgi:hypothetical protein
VHAGAFPSRTRLTLVGVVALLIAIATPAAAPPGKLISFAGPPSPTSPTPTPTPTTTPSGPGADRLIGGLGRDRLIGGAGSDQLLGGPGKDSQQQ